MPKLGHVKDVTFDAKGYERRERLDALARCPECGAEVECWAETEAWTEGADGRRPHAEYGGAMGLCEKCRILIVDCLSDGFRAIRLPEKGKEKSP